MSASTQAVARASQASSWSHRLALATLITAVPLIFFGGTVTTLHAGLAIDGWLVLEPGRGDWFLWFYPVEQWLRDVGTFVEHTHRLLGSAVGLLAIATAIAAGVQDRRGLAFKLTGLALLAVIVQGVLGGLRVLEKSEDLAFLHGAFGQLVFAAVGAGCVVTSRRWREARALASDETAKLSRLALFTTSMIYAEIVIGAWLRHGGQLIALALHMVSVLGVVSGVLLLMRELARLAARAEQHTHLRRLRRNLGLALALQISLGLCAFVSVYFVVGKNPGSVPQSLFPTLHVMGGAALLLTSLTTLLWSSRTPRAVAAVREHVREHASQATPRAQVGALR